MQDVQTMQTMKEEILRLKKEKDVCILVHAYQAQELLEVADFVGDSYGLSLEAAKAPQKNLLLCGVRFMAETVKILSPEKRVWLSNEEAGCPMAEQMEKDEILRWKKEHPRGAVVAYVNTTAELKTVSDVCVTSSSALQVVKAMPQREIYFIPDCNLGAFVAGQVPDKQFDFFRGGCPIHGKITVEDVQRQKALHPHAKVLVHPECRAEVTALADYVGSTTGIMAWAKRSCSQEFLIGTETSIVQHLQFACPDKRFYPLSKQCICADMRLTTLADIYRILVSPETAPEIRLPSDVIEQADRCLAAMLQYGS